MSSQATDSGVYLDPVASPFETKLRPGVAVSITGLEFALEQYEKHSGGEYPRVWIVCNQDRTTARSARSHVAVKDPRALSIRVLGLEAVPQDWWVLTGPAGWVVSQP